MPGDIEWKRTDTPVDVGPPEPKTWELSNKPPMEPPGLPETPAMSELIRSMTGPQLSQEELKNMQTGMAMRERKRWAGDDVKVAREPTRRDHYRQLRTFNRYMKQGGTDLVSGVQELVDSGAAWIDENGDVYTAVPHHDPEGKILEAFRQWQDRQDQYMNAFQDAGINPMDNSPEARAKKFEIMGSIVGREAGLRASEEYRKVQQGK